MTDSSSEQDWRRTSTDGGPEIEHAFDETGVYPPGVRPKGPAPLPEGVHSTSPWMRLVGWILEPILFVVTLGIGWAVWAYALGGGGQTPAKKILKQRVIRVDDAQPATLSRMFLMRWFVGALVVPVVATVTLGIILLMPFWDTQNRNLWDRISSTRVVDDPDNVWDQRADFIGD